MKTETKHQLLEYFEFYTDSAAIETKQLVSETLTALLNVKKEVNAPCVDNDNIGICSRVELYMDSEDTWNFWEETSKALFRMWPEFSGEMFYPVRMPDHMYMHTPSSGYARIPAWEGQYGQSRRRLLDFLIEGYQLWEEYLDAVIRLYDRM